MWYVVTFEGSVSCTIDTLSHGISMYSLRHEVRAPTVNNHVLEIDRQLFKVVYEYEYDHRHYIRSRGHNHKK